MALQVAVPFLCFVILFVIVVFVIYKRTHVCRRKRRKDNTVVKSNENEQLLDGLSVINKNPSYFTALDEITKGKQLQIKDIPKEQIQIYEVVGEGAFGQVYKGRSFNSCLTICLCCNWMLILSNIIRDRPYTQKRVGWGGRSIDYTLKRVGWGRDIYGFCWNNISFEEKSKEVTACDMDINNRL